jgi:inner membrane organizing system protein 1
MALLPRTAWLALLSATLRAFSSAAAASPRPAPCAGDLVPSSQVGDPVAVRPGRKWDACLDLSICRVAYSSLAGTFTGLLLFREQ